MSTPQRSSIMQRPADAGGPGDDKYAAARRHRRPLLYSLGKGPPHRDPRDWFQAIALAVRDRYDAAVGWRRCGRAARAAAGKRVYYLSAEFLTGRLAVERPLNSGFERGVHDAG